MGDMQWGSQKRKSALWNLLATEVWLLNGNASNAKECLGNAKALYALSKNNSKTPPFDSMEGKWDELHQELASIEEAKDEVATIEAESLDEVQEELHNRSEGKKGHQKRVSMGFQPAQEDVRDLLQRLSDPLSQDDDGFS